VGRTWKNADFRMTFAKCKTHEHDWLTLGIKNVYGCFPSPAKIRTYHMRDEVFDVTARSLANFSVHFSIVDAHLASDGFQGYKIANHPRPLKMLFGGADPVAVDMEIFARAGLDYRKSKFLKTAVEQLHGGAYPQYTVVGDATQFAALGPWENIDDDIVAFIDRAEEVYVAWGFINLKPAAVHVDYAMFPPKNVFFRIAVWLMRRLYALLSCLGLYKR
jgi:uncharacterized protein (DUF362 family)